MIWIILMTTILASVLLGSALSCTKEEYLAKFGLPYQIRSKAFAPAIEGGYLVAEVEYMSQCGEEKPKANFRADMFDPEVEELGEMGKVAMLHRLDDTCERKLDEPVKILEKIAVEIEGESLRAFKQQHFKFLAFPPDGEYEIFNLEVRERTDKSVPASTVDGRTAEVLPQGATSSNRSEADEADETMEGPFGLPAHSAPVSLES